MLLLATVRWLRSWRGVIGVKPVTVTTPKVSSRPLVKDDSVPRSIPHSDPRSSSVIMLPSSTPEVLSGSSVMASGQVSPASWNALLRDQLASSPSPLTRRGTSSAHPISIGSSPIAAGLATAAPSTPSSSTPAARTPSLLTSPLVKRASPLTPAPAASHALSASALRIPPSPLQRGSVSDVTASSAASHHSILMPEPAQVERMAQWLVRMVLRPLQRECEQVREAFEACGWAHLAPLATTASTIVASTPAAPSLTASHSLPDRITLQPPAPTASLLSYQTSPPQSLAELSTRPGNEALIRRRMRLETWLTPPPACAQQSRMDVWRLLGEMVADGASLARAEHAWMALHWICCHLDEHLADGSRPGASFSSRHVQLNPGPGSGQLRLVMISPLVFQLGLPTYNMVAVPQVHSACTNLLEAMVMLVSYAHRNQRGYLGMGNLGTSSINLLSIL